MNSKSLMLALLVGVAPVCALAAPAYAPSMSIPLGDPSRWDYVVFDAPSDRVYVAHGDQVAVVDAKAGVVIGKVEGVAGGTHGVGISQATGQGFSDDGRKGEVIAFDLKTFAIKAHIAADPDADAIVMDKASGRVLVVEGDPGKIKLVDPKTDTVAATIDGGEKMEYPAADGAGLAFVAGEEKKDLLKVDLAAGKVVARWATPDCDSPHGLALDVAGHRAFMGCVNSVMMVVDTKTGNVVAKLPIGRGSDAVAYDARRKRVFSSNGVDGTITVYQQTSPDSYEALDTVATAVSARTMAVDPQSGRLFLAAADVDPPAAPGGRPRPKPGTLRLLVLDPVGGK